MSCLKGVINPMKLSTLLILVILLLPTLAWANDTELTYGGTPKPLNGNTTISMKSEFVSMVIGDKYVTVDCRFTFENSGPVRKVRMGFPDEGGEIGEDVGPDGKVIHKAPTGTFMRFDSWVNGKKVKTSVIKAAEEGSVWHIKMVQFRANRTLEVRDRYTVPLGGSIAHFPVGVHLAKYVLHTGSSWRGPLGRSVVEVVFKSKGVRSPLAPKPLPKTNNRGMFAKNVNLDKHIVYYSGPCKPVASGKTLRFVRNSWRPEPKDDIYLMFDMNRQAVVKKKL